MPAVGWLDRRLAQQGVNADDLVLKDHQQQGAINVTVRNIITSMRLVTDVDWTTLFEKVSPVDEIFRSAGTFETMDFATRNLYRTAIEQIARGTALGEVELARRTCALAAAQSSNERSSIC